MFLTLEGRGIEGGWSERGVRQVDGPGGERVLGGGGGLAVVSGGARFIGWGSRMEGG